MKSTLTWSLLFALVITLGCGGGSDGRPANYVKATGVVMLDDKPLADADVNFFSVDKSGGAGGLGRTDANGKFSIKYRGTTEGVPPAQYKVTVSKMVKSDGSPIPAGMSPTDAGAVEAIPARYSDSTQTTLTATVEATPKEHEFKIQSK